MILSEWLAGRTPRPPEALAQRIRSALGASLHERVDENDGRAYAALLSAARSLLDGEGGCRVEDRQAARDLLAADALVTYAFELAAEEPDELAALAERAMRDFGELGAEGTA